MNPLNLAPHAHRVAAMTSRRNPRSVKLERRKTRLFRYRLSTLLLLTTALAVIVEMVRALTRTSDGLFFIGLAFVFPGAAASALAVGLGYTVGGRLGATLASVGALIIWVAPIWLLYAAEAAAPEAASVARWLYTLLALVVFGATVGSIWRDGVDPAETNTLGRLRQVKQDLKLRVHPRRDE